MNNNAVVVLLSLLIPVNDMLFVLLDQYHVLLHVWQFDHLFSFVLLHHWLASTTYFVLRDVIPPWHCSKQGIKLLSFFCWRPFIVRIPFSCCSVACYFTWSFCWHHSKQGNGLLSFFTCWCSFVRMPLFCCSVGCYFARFLFPCHRSKQGNGLYSFFTCWFFVVRMLFLVEVLGVTSCNPSLAIPNKVSEIWVSSVGVPSL